MLSAIRPRSSTRTFWVHWRWQWKFLAAVRRRLKQTRSNVKSAKCAKRQYLILFYSTKFHILGLKIQNVGKRWLFLLSSHEWFVGENLSLRVLPTLILWPFVLLPLLSSWWHCFKSSDQFVSNLALGWLVTGPRYERIHLGRCFLFQVYGNKDEKETAWCRVEIWQKHSD